MTVTLKPVLEALGYSSVAQQRAVVKLMQAAGAFGKVQGAEDILTDKQADAVLQNVTYNDLAQAAKLLHQVTQESMISRPAGAERDVCEDSEHFIKYRTQLMEALQQGGMLDMAKPSQKYYDHVLVLGSTEAEVDKRLDYLKQLWDQGVRFGKIHMLGSERALHAQSESSAGITGPNGAEAHNEMDMMEARYYAKSASWPKEMQNVRIFEVNTYNKDTGERANTQDTIKAWAQMHPEQGEVLALSSQPYVRYQDAAVKSALTSSYHVETVGESAPRDLKVSVALDSFARQIDVALPKLLERLKLRKSRTETQLVMIDPTNIQVDAATYQFRAGGDAHGVTNKGRYHAESWDPMLHGDPILVHERLDGRIFVADGHHRVDLAKTLNTKGTGPGKMAAMVLREADGYTPKDVKIIAAYKNLAHGHNDVVDAARVFKEANSGEINLDLLPQLQMDKGNLRIAYSMSKLSEKALDSVSKGELPAEMAAIVADRLPNNHKRQENVMSLIHKKLHQDYDMKDNAHPTRLQVNGLNVTGSPGVLPGFVEKLAQQRAGSTPSLGMSA